MNGHNCHTCDSSSEANICIPRDFGMAFEVQQIRSFAKIRLAVSRYQPEMTMTLLESLKKYTTVVADTGDIEAIARHRPQDATTNPSLLFKAAEMPGYRHLVEEAETLALARSGNHGETAEEFIDRLFVLFGCEILKVVPGRVSTEVAASLSFDTAGTIAKARKLISLYDQKGVARERVLIKIASTWEGIRAAEILEK